MYLTKSDEINRQLEAGSVESNSQTLWNLIDDDINSKSKKEMKEGEKYYINEPDIDSHDFRLYYKNKSETAFDYSASNIKAKGSDHTLLVDQKKDYIIGKNPTVTISPENPDLEDLLTDKLFEELREQVQGASNKGVEWLHPFVNESGEFDYTIISAIECVPSYETQYLRTLEKMYRYYSTEIITGRGNVTEELKFTLEIWDKETVKIYEAIKTTYSTGKIEKGTFVLVEERFHFNTFNTTNPDSRTGQGWGLVPFIKLKNNNKEKSDLIKYKGLIDGLNMIRSKGVNTLADIQEIIYVIKGYADRNENTSKQVDQAERVRTKLKTQKIAFVDGQGGVDAIQAEMPVEATEKIIGILKEEIYEYGQGVRVSKDQAGNQTGVGLTFQYSALETKAKPLMRSIKQVIKELIGFYAIFLNKTDKRVPDYEVDITFNTSMIIDEAQLVDNLMKSNASLKTKLKNDPFVEDVESELDQIKEERLSNTEEFEPVEDAE